MLPILPHRPSLKNARASNSLQSPPVSKQEQNALRKRALSHTSPENGGASTKKAPASSEGRFPQLLGIAKQRGPRPKESPGPSVRLTFGSLLLLDRPHDGLVNLDQRNDQEAERKCGNHALGLKMLHAEEDHRERVDLDHDERENEREERGAP